MNKNMPDTEDLIYFVSPFDSDIAVYQRVSEIERGLDEAASLVNASTATANSLLNRLENDDTGPTTLKLLAVTLFKVKEKYDKVEEARKKLYAVLDRVNKGVLPNMFDKLEQGRTQIPLIERSVGVLDKMSTSMVDKDLAFAWLRKVGAGELITQTVNASTLAAFVKGHIEKTAEDPPLDAIKVNSYKTTSFVRYAPK